MEILCNLGLDLSRTLGRLALNKAQSLQVPMVIAISDTKGDLVHFQRMDQALPVSLDIAVNKAFTAATLRMPTHKAGPLTLPGQPLYGLELTNQGKMVVFGGGYPLIFSGEVAGAIGVSGGSVDQDMMVAEAVVEGFADMKKIARTLAPLVPETMKDVKALVHRAAATDAMEGLPPDILEGALYLIRS